MHGLLSTHKVKSPPPCLQRQITTTHLTKINRFPAAFIPSKTCFKCGFSSKYFSGSCATNLWKSPDICVLVILPKTSFTALLGQNGISLSKKNCTVSAIKQHSAMENRSLRGLRRRFRSDGLRERLPEYSAIRLGRETRCRPSHAEATLWV